MNSELIRSKNWQLSSSIKVLINWRVSIQLKRDAHPQSYMAFPASCCACLSVITCLYGPLLTVLLIVQYQVYWWHTRKLNYTRKWSYPMCVDAVNLMREMQRILLQLSYFCHYFILFSIFFLQFVVWRFCLY